MNALTSLDKDSAKRDRSQLEHELKLAGATNTDRKSLKCPFHDDTRPSAQIRETPSGFWQFTCFVCAISDDVWALRARVQGRDVGDVLKEAAGMEPRSDYTPRQLPPAQAIVKAEKPKPPVQYFDTIEDLIESYRRRRPYDVIEEKNAYTDPRTGAADFYTIRIQPHDDPKKTFKQASRTEAGWVMEGIKGSAPLFNRGRIEKCEKILIVEGEKCVRAVTAIGIQGVAATTSPGGSSAAGKADWSPLAGKHCYVWRDNDEPGMKYEATVIAELAKLDPPCLIYRIRVEELELPPKGDVADYLNEESMTNAEKVASLQLVMFDAEPLHVTSALEKKFDAIIAGEYRAIPFLQKPLLSENSKAIMPGMLTTLCGEPGAGKSFWILEDFWRWSLKGERVKLLMLEDDDAFHQNRALAQMSGYAELLDPDYVLAHPEVAKRIFAEYREPLEAFSRNMKVATGQMSLDEIAKWVIMHAEAGVRVIGVDPITAAKASDKPWIEDQKFLFTVKAVLERTGASLILNTHPRMGQAGKPSLSGMAGGAAYPRFSQTVIWLKNFDKVQDARVWDGYTYTTTSHKQVAQIRKCRNGKGQGKQIAINLNFQNLCFDEHGEIDEATTDE